MGTQPPAYQDESSSVQSLRPARSLIWGGDVESVLPSYQEAGVLPSPKPSQNPQHTMAEVCPDHGSPPTSTAPFHREHGEEAPSEMDWSRQTYAG